MRYEVPADAESGGMITKRYDIWDEGEYSYEAAYGFVPNLRTYLHDDETERPCMLVVPGGGYCMVVPPEAEIVAKEFYNMGMNAFVLTYTTDITMSVPLGKQPLFDISRAVRFIRKNASLYNINPGKITVCGFSAGAHVCGTLCVHYDDVEDGNPSYKDISNRPDASILSYPVITTGEFTHIYSVWALVGQNAPKEDVEYFSLEKHVTANTPPCFIWQTAEDDLVPVENSYLYAMALRKSKVPFAHYVFPYGHHGLSVATEDFYRGVFGEPYTMEQVMAAVENVRNNTAVRVSEKRRQELIEQFASHPENGENSAPTPSLLTNPYPDVSKWPALAMEFLSSLQ